MGDYKMECWKCGETSFYHNKGIHALIQSFEALKSVGMNKQPLGLEETGVAGNLGNVYTIRQRCTKIHCKAFNDFNVKYNATL